MRGWPVSLILFSLICLSLSAQDVTGDDSVHELDQISTEDTLKIPADSLETEPDTTEPATLTTAETHPVGTAMLLSALLPGGGQFYNQRYHKGGVIAGAELALGALTVREHLLMLAVEEAWSVFPDSVSADELEYHRARRNMFAFFTGAVIAYAVADAYVDSHMFGFREQQRLTVAPSPVGLGLTLTYRFYPPVTPVTPVTPRNTPNTP